MRFGEYLFENGAVTEEALKNALQTQKYKPIKVGRLLRNLGHLSQTELNKNLIGFVQPRNLETLESGVTQLKKAAVCESRKKWGRRHGVIPFEMGERMSSYLSSDFRDEVIEDGEIVFNESIDLIITDSASMKYLSSKFAETTDETGENLDSNKVISIKRGLSDDDKISQVDPYTQLFRATILEARKSGASDIHIQPTREGIDIRLRVCGDLKTWKSLSEKHRYGFINEVKRLTGLSIAISGRAQDGRISFKNWKLDIRTSLLPSHYGEKIVLRLLDLTRSFDLESIEFDAETKSDLRQALKAKSGVIIISGPTGSGKTTTLYTLLSSLDRSGKNIITLEDPIEYGIEGLTQVQIGPKLKFPDALRAVLRQDPDIILVGEVRDAETADLCVKAALTGHLVLSTLHANGSREVVNRLLNLGVDVFSLKASLKFCAAQRLIKKLCGSCALKIEEDELQRINERLKETGLSLDFKGKYQVRKQAGCRDCHEGITGRVPILEYLKASEIETYLTKGESEFPVVVKSLLSQAMGLAGKGETDVNDALEIG